MTKQIKSLAGLISATQKGHNDYHILLAGGSAKSSKWIDYDMESKKFIITNLIDDSEQELTEKQMNMKRYTNIGEAIIKGALIQE